MILKKEKIHINIFLGIGITITNGLMSFFITRVFGHSISQESLGVLKLFTQLLSYLNLAELGLGVAAASLLYKPIHEQDIKKINNILYTLTRFFQVIALVVILIGVILSIYLDFFIENISLEYRIVWILFVFSTGCTYFFAKYPIYFSANQQFGFVQKVRGGVKCFLQIFQLISLICFQSFYIFSILMLVFVLFEWSIYLLVFKRIYINNEINKGKIHWELISKAKKTLIHKVSTILVFSTDYIVIAKFLTVNVVAIYSSYMMVVNFLGMLLNVIFQSIRPKIGLIANLNSKAENLELWKTLFLLCNFLGCFLSVLIYFFLTSVVEVWMGTDYILSRVTVALIALNFFVYIQRQATDILKESLGYFDDIHLPIIEGSFNLVFSLLLVKEYGLNGVVIGTLFSNIIVILIMRPYVVFKRLFNTGFSTYLYFFVKCMIFCSLIYILTEWVFIFVSTYDFIFLTFTVTVLFCFCICCLVFSLDYYFRHCLVVVYSKIRVFLFSQ